MMMNEMMVGRKFDREHRRATCSVASCRAPRFDEETLRLFDVPISSDQVDEHRSIVIQRGLETRDGQPLHGARGSVVLQADHGFKLGDVLGRVSNFRLVDVRGVPTTVADAQFGTGERALEAFEQFAAGIATDFSIGFVPLDFRAPTEEEEARRAQEVITRAKLLEVSAVAIGSNPMASTLLSHAAALTRAVRALGSGSSTPTRPAGLDVSLLCARLAAIRAQLSTMR